MKFELKHSCPAQDSPADLEYYLISQTPADGYGFCVMRRSRFSFSGEFSGTSRGFSKKQAECFLQRLFAGRATPVSVQDLLEDDLLSRILESQISEIGEDKESKNTR